MSSVKLPVDFVGQEVEMGFASEKTILLFSNIKSVLNSSLVPWRFSDAS